MEVHYSDVIYKISDEISGYLKRFYKIIARREYSNRPYSVKDSLLLLDINRAEKMLDNVRELAGLVRRIEECNETVFHSVYIRDKDKGLVSKRLKRLLDDTRVMLDSRYVSLTCDPNYYCPTDSSINKGELLRLITKARNLVYDIFVLVRLLEEIE